MAATAQIFNCLYTSTRDVSWISSPGRISSSVQVPNSKFAPFGTAFATGSPLSIRTTSRQSRPACRVSSLSIRCEQSANESNGLDVWLGRLAMIGFAAAISVEVATGKGLLENFGLTSPLPTVALAVTALVGVLTAVFIFQSASKS